ncbi:hypothetical protein GQR58_004744 [Nymphon striatum]|nr:hypothetical protein GQR58_004744 [Nymphon striatum]
MAVVFNLKSADNFLDKAEQKMGCIAKSNNLRHSAKDREFSLGVTLHLFRRVGGSKGHQRVMNLLPTIQKFSSNNALLPQTELYHPWQAVVVLISNTGLPRLPYMGIAASEKEIGPINRTCVCETLMKKEVQVLWAYGTRWRDGFSLIFVFLVNSNFMS